MPPRQDCDNVCFLPMNPAVILYVYLTIVVDRPWTGVTYSPWWQLNIQTRISEAMDNVPPPTHILVQYFFPLRPTHSLLLCMFLLCVFQRQPSMNPSPGLAPVFLLHFYLIMYFLHLMEFGPKNMRERREALAFFGLHNSRSPPWLISSLEDSGYETSFETVRQTC